MGLKKKKSSNFKWPFCSTFCFVWQGFLLLSLPPFQPQVMGVFWEAQEWISGLRISSLPTHPKTTLPADVKSCTDNLKLPFWFQLFFQADATRLRSVWMHSYYLLIHISQGQGLPSFSKGQKLYICSQAPPSIAPSPSLRFSVPQHFCPHCQVPQTSASSTPALRLKNVSGKNLEWLSPSEIYSSLFWSHPSRTPLPAQRSLWTAVLSDTNLFCLPLLSFSLHRAVAIAQKQLNRAWLDLSSVYLFRQRLPPRLFHMVSTVGVQISHLFFSSSQSLTTSWTSPSGSVAFFFTIFF